MGGGCSGYLASAVRILLPVSPREDNSMCVWVQSQPTWGKLRDLPPGHFGCFVSSTTPCADRFPRALEERRAPSRSLLLPPPPLPCRLAYGTNPRAGAVQKRRLSSEAPSPCEPPRGSAVGGHLPGRTGPAAGRGGARPPRAPRCPPGDGWQVWQPPAPPGCAGTGAAGTAVTRRQPVPAEPPSCQSLPRKARNIHSEQSQRPRPAYRLHY